MEMKSVNSQTFTETGAAVKIFNKNRGNIGKSQEWGGIE